MAGIALPSVTVQVGQTRKSADINVPANIHGARLEIDASGWSAGTKVRLTIESSINGKAWGPIVTCLADADQLPVSGIIDLGFSITQDPTLQVRGMIEVLSGSAVTLAGFVYADGTRPPDRFNRG